MQCLHLSPEEFGVISASEEFMLSDGEIQEALQKRITIAE